MAGSRKVKPGTSILETCTPFALIRDGRRNRAFMAWRAVKGRGAGSEEAMQCKVNAVRISPSLIKGILFSPCSAVVVAPMWKLVRSASALALKVVTTLLGICIVCVKGFAPVNISHANLAPNLTKARPFSCLDFSTYSSCGALVASSVNASNTSSCAPSTGGTSVARPANTLDHAERKAAWPMTSMSVCGHDKPTSVASLKDVICTDIWGVSPASRSSMVMGAEGDVARSLKSVGPGHVEMVPVGLIGSFLASSCCWMEDSIVVWV